MTTTPVPGGIGGTPPGAALDQFLRDSYTTVQAVHQQLDAIRAVASHLTPVEDLVEFQNEIRALHAKLGVLVAASELIVQASDAGIALLLAVDAAAQRVLLQLGSAALEDADYFTRSEEFLALSTQVAQLNDTLDQVLVVLAGKLDKAEFEARIGPLEERVGVLEAGLVSQVGDTNTRLTELISQLDAGYGFAKAAAVDSLTTRVATTETGLLAESTKTTALQAQVTDLANGVSGQATALQVLTTRVESSAQGIDALTENVVALNTQVANLETGQTAQSNALQSLTSRTTTNEDTISAQGTALTQLDASVQDARNQVALHASALSGLDVRMQSSEAGQLALSAQTDQLAVRLTDAETGLQAQADAAASLSTRIEATEDALTVASEERTSLRASISSTGNHLPNSGFAAGVRGWTLFSRGDGWLSAQLSRDLAPSAPGALPVGMHALSLTVAGVPVGTAGIRCNNVPVEDLAGYLLSGYLAAENCTVRLEWRLLDGAGTEIGYGLVGVSSKAPSAQLSGWDRVHALVPVASDGASLQVQLWVTECHTGAPKAWLLRPQLEPRVGEQTLPSPWMEGVSGIEENFATAVETLETRVTLTEDGLEALAEQVTNLSAGFGSVRQWRLTCYSGSGAYTDVGAPLPAGLRQADSSTPVHALQRGLTLLRFAANSSLASAVRYDTFASASERTRLCNDLLALGPGDAFVLVSQDHHGIKQADLTAAIESCGGYAFANVTGSRPYLLIGRGQAGKGGGREILQAGNVPWTDHYFTVVNDTPMGLGEAAGVAEAIAGQANALDTLTARVTSNEDGLETLSSAVTTLDGRLATTETAVTTQGQATSDLTVRMTATENQVVVLTQDVTDLGAQLETTNQDLSAATGAVSSLGARMDATETQVLGLANDTTQLSGRLTDAEAGVLSNTSALSALTTRVSNAEGVNENQASSLTQLSSQLSAIGGENLLPNAGFEDASNATPTRARHWTTAHSLAPNATLSRPVSGLPLSTVSQRADCTAVDAGGYLSLRAANTDGLDYPQVEGGEAYVLSTHVKATAGCDLQVYVQWLNSSNAVLSTSTSTITVTTGGWQRVVFPVTAHASAVKALVYAGRVFNTSAAAQPLFLEVDNAQFQEGALATAYAPSTLYGDQANAEAITGLTTRVTDAEGSLVAISGAQTALTSRVGEMEGALVNEIITSANKDAAHTASLNNLSARMTDVEGDVVANAQAVAGLDTRVSTAEGTLTSHSSSLTSLQAQVNAIDADTGGSGAAISALDTRVTQNEQAIESQGQAITSLQNSVTSANKIFVQATAPSTTGRINGDLWINTADNNRVYSFNSATGTWVLRQDTSKSRVFVQAAAPTGANVNDLWFDLDDNYRVYRWTGSAWQEVTDPRTSANATAITNLTTRVTNVEGVNTAQANSITTINSKIDSPTSGLTALANATNSLTTRVTDAEGNISAQASSLSSLSTTVNGNTATINQQASSINGLKAAWSVTLDVNGYISGLKNENNGSKSSFEILADKFKIIAPSGGARTEFSGGNWRVYDAAGVLRVRMGVW